MTVTVKKVGGSLAVIIPREVAREMELAVGTALDISTAGGAIVMRKQGRRARRPLGGIVSRISAASYRRRGRKSGNDGPVGREVW
jgi:antitoxin component of MazEF toxin-antitoxin module